LPLKNIARVIIAALVVTAAFFGLFYEPAGDSGDSAQGLAEENEEVNNETPALRVSTTSLEEGSLADELVRSGELASWREAEVYPELTAEVLEVYVSAGDAVTEGDVLARLDGEDYRDEARAAESSLQSAQVQYREAEITYERMRDELENMRELFKAGAVSRRELLEMEDQVEVAKEGLQGARSMIEQSETQLSAARRMLERTEVSSPITGTVSAVVMERGDMATTQAPMVIVNQLDPLKVELTVDERHINKLEEGQDVEVMVSAAREEPFSGEIHKVYPTAVEGTRSFPVIIEVDNPEADLRPGMYAEVVFTLVEVEDAWLAPRDAVVSRDDEDYLFFVEDGHAAAYQVEKGLSSEGKVEVYGDFDPELDLIADPPHDVEDGEQVQAGDL